MIIAREIVKKFFAVLPLMKLKKESLTHTASWICTISKKLHLRMDVKMYVDSVGYAQTLEAEVLNEHRVSQAFSTHSRHFHCFCSFGKLRYSE